MMSYEKTEPKKNFFLGSFLHSMPYGDREIK